MEYRSWMCLICGWIYDEAAGDPEHGLPPGTAWNAVPMNWTCPECGARRWEAVPLSGEGTIASYTIIRVAPPAS